MDPKQVRAYALDAAMRLHPEMTNLSDLISEADRISDFISPPPRPKPPAKKTSPFLTDEIRELVKVSESVLEFSKFCHISDPIKGSIKFDAYPFQEHLLGFMQDQPRTVVNMARQMGKTTCIAIYALWYAMFNNDKTIMVISSRFVSAMEIMARIRYMYEQLPAHLRLDVSEYNKGAIQFENGTRIVARAANQDAFRGLHVSLTIIDELAYVSHSVAPDMWNAMVPRMSVDLTARCIITSTPKLTADLFHRIWLDAEPLKDLKTVAGMNGFAPFFAPWDCHPDRDDAWAAQMRSNMSEHAFAREYECRFLSE